MSRAGPTSAAVAALAARASYALLRARPPAGADTWTRTNHRGEPITLLEGPAVAIGGMAGAAVATGLSRRYKAALIVAAAGAAAFGGYDDLAGDTASKGFRGHIGALRRGELTTGALKLVGIGATGLAAALVPGRPRPGSGRAGGGGSAADAIIDAALIAGSANLLNLFDLRPGRAIKVAIGAGALLSASPAARGRVTAPLAAAGALLPADLGEQAMLGDAGANALGAMLGVAATGLSRPARVAALAGIVGLTAASEVVSFTRVIERTAPLRWLDMLGRRPAQASAQPPAAQPPAAQPPAAQSPAAQPPAAQPPAAQSPAAQPPGASTRACAGASGQAADGQPERAEEPR